jgi:hypothetical protein
LHSGFCCLEAARFFKSPCRHFAHNGRRPADNVEKDAEVSSVMLSSETLEPSDLEMSKMLRKALEEKRRKRAILAFAIGLLAVVAFWEAWDRGIIAPVVASIWNMLCRLAEDWRAFLQEAFPFMLCCNLMFQLAYLALNQFQTPI